MLAIVALLLLLLYLRIHHIMRFIVVVAFLLLYFDWHRTTASDDEVVCLERNNEYTYIQTHTAISQGISQKQLAKSNDPTVVKIVCTVAQREQNLFSKILG